VSDNYTGLFQGTVFDNDDPLGKCRLRVEVPQVLDGPTGWCDPSLPYAGDGSGFAAVPSKGAAVHIQWPRGDLSEQPVWSGANFSDGSGVSGAGPDTLIILTPGGHRLELSDDGKALTIECSEGPVITLDKDGISIDNGQGASILMKGSSVNINNGALEVK
jgi:hypothetical protein